MNHPESYTAHVAHQYAEEAEQMRKERDAAIAERDEWKGKAEREYALRRDTVDAWKRDEGRIVKLSVENQRLTAQVTELQALGTAHVEERRQCLNRIAAIVHEVAKSKGWYDKPVSIEAFVANGHGEWSELFEAYRRNALNEPCDKASKMTEPLSCFEEEVADILIRTLDMAADRGIDVDRAVRVKTAFNRTRERMHGKIV